MTGMQAPPIALALKRGGDAFILERSEEFVTLASSLPSPPGSTVEATFAGPPRSVSLRVKVRGCRKDTLPDGRPGFRIEGRLVSLSRGDREVLFGSEVERSHAETDPRSTSET
jgi:hypothetical protein